MSSLGGRNFWKSYHNDIPGKYGEAFWNHDGTFCLTKALAVPIAVAQNGHKAVETGRLDMSCCQTVQNNWVLSMLASTHFHILPYFSSFSVLPTPTYHPLRMLTISHPLHGHRHQPMIRCLHSGLGDCWFVGFLCWFVSILCFLCLLGGILGTLGLGVSKARSTSAIFNRHRLYQFFWWPTQSQ